LNFRERPRKAGALTPHEPAGRRFQREARVPDRRAPRRRSRRARDTSPSPLKLYRPPVTPAGIALRLSIDRRSLKRNFAPGSSLGNLPLMKILVVDDHPLICEALHGVLDPFAVVIRSTCDGKADNKTISKWSRALRYVARVKKPRRPLTTFMKNRGGINACAGLYAEQVRRSKR
jgi:hypothetical protein